MASPHDIDLVEYERLRHEIDNRTQLSYGLVALALTALGAGLTVSDRFPNVTLVLALLSTLLWLLWTDHTAQILKIAAYIGLHLAPRLCNRDTRALGWECFLRELDAGSRSAAHALGNPDTQPVRIRKTKDINRYIAVLFGGASLLLATISVFPFGGWSLAAGLQVAAIVLILACWLFALRQYCVVEGMQRMIDGALLRAGDRGGTDTTRQRPSTTDRQMSTNPGAPRAASVATAATNPGRGHPCW